VKLSSTVRTPYRLPSPIASTRARSSDDLGLSRAIVLSQLAVVLLCVARVGTDILHRRLGIEGSLALTLAVAFVVPLAKKFSASGLVEAARRRARH
jgi:hypothetical protein